MYKKVLIFILTIMLVVNTCFAPPSTYPIRHNTVQPPRRLARLLLSKFTALDNAVTTLEASQNGIFSNIGTGSVFYVDSSAAADGAGTTWATAYDTLQEGVDACTDNAGDIVYVAQGHAETVASAAALDFDKAGITIVGIGNGEDMPEISLISILTATVQISAADVMLYNLRFLGNFANGVTECLDITADGDGAIIAGCEFRETTNDKELLIMITLTAAADEIFIIGNRFIGIAGGDASVAINIEGASDQTVIASNYFYGDWSDYVIKNAAASISMLIENNVINNLDTGAGKLMTFHSGSTGSVVNNKCYGNGGTFAFVGAAMSLTPDNIFMNTEVVTRTFEQMTGSFTGATTGLQGTTIFADMVLAQTDLDAILQDFLDYQLDTLAGISTAVNADGNLETHVIDKSVLSHIMTAGADTSDYAASTMSLEALNTDLDTIIVATVTDMPSTLSGINTSISAISAYGYAGFKGTCTSNPANTSQAACTTLAGFGEDYFNTGWSLMVVLNADSAGSDPEGDIIDIIAYATGTGLFTLNVAASAQITTGDGIFIVRKEELNLDDVTMLGGSGTVWYLNSATSGDETGLTWENASKTLTAVEALMAAGDICYIAASHDEEIGDVIINLAGVSFIGLGEGDARPLLTCNDATDEITITAAGVTLKNLRLEPGANTVAKAFRIDSTGDGCTLENISFIKGEGSDEEFVICIDLHATAYQLTVKDCTYHNTAATTANTSCFIDLTEGTIDGCTIIGCNLFGEFADGAIYSTQTLTNLSIIDNVISNTTGTKYAIYLTGAPTGVLINNRLYSDDYTTMLDPGALKCSGNIGANAADQQGIAMPLSADTSDVTEVADGSNLERLEILQNLASDALGLLGAGSAGKIIYVDSGEGTGTEDGLTWATAHDTLIEAIDDGTDNAGDVILVAAGHAEDVGTDAINCPGITIIGLGVGEERPVLTFNTASDVLAHTVANVKYKNLIFTVSGQDCTVAVTLDAASDGAVFEDCVFRSASGDLEFVSTITFSAGACNNVRFTRCKFDNTGGTGATAAITNLVGAQVNLTIEDCEFNGVWSEAAINSTQADLNLVLRNNLVTNTSSTKFAIELESASSTGFLVDNLCYANTYGSVIDPGGLKCYNNRVSSAVDQSGSIYPAVPQQIDSIHGTGQVFYVDVSASNGDGRTWATAKNALDDAITLCTSDRGDFIYVAQGHTESYGAVTGFTLNKAGISIIGLGNGDNRPIFSFTNGAGTILTTNAGDNILLENLKFLATVDSVLICINIVDGTDNVTIRNCVFEAETAATDEFDESIQIGNACIGTTIDNCVFDMANNDAVAAISSDNDTAHTTIKNCMIMGDYSTACIEFAAVASTDLHILDNIMINGDLVGNNGLNSEPCLEIIAATGGFIKGNYFAADVAINHLAMTVAADMVFMENYTTDDDGDAFEGTRRSDTAAVTASADG